MADIQVTDQLDKPVESIKVDLSHPSSLLKYLKSEVLHLAVFPDFLELKDSSLSQAAPNKPIQFQATAQHKFQLGTTGPKIDVTPKMQAKIRVNASPGTNLFDGDTFHAPAKVPGDTGFLSVGFQGSFTIAVSDSAGDLTFGFGKSSTIGMEYLKAFPLGAGEPALGDALGRTLSSYVIPATLADLEALGINDVATASGQGSLKVSGGVKVTVSPNPLASVDLPLGTGAVAIKAGESVGLSASFAVTGSYQIRARRKDADTVELGFLREAGTTLIADVSESAGITAELGDKDLIGAVFGAISTDPLGDKKLLGDLQPAEIKTLSEAIKGGVNHSFQSSVDVTLSGLRDDQAAFQYEIQPARLSPGARLAVDKALNGDLSLLTGMEEDSRDGGILAPGLKMLNSVLTETRKRGITLKINLLGILNLLSLSELIRRSEILTDPGSGDVTIKETVTGHSLSTISDPLERHEALRKAIFHSVLATTTYRAGKVVILPDLGCEQLHFALHRNTSRQTMSDYLSWFAALDLLTAEEKPALLSPFVDGVASTCVLRTSFRDADCESMFFDGAGMFRSKDFYLEIGRQALRALLDPANGTIEGLRFKIVDNALWPAARQTGANVNLGPLVGLSTGDSRVQFLIDDVSVITDWAEAMSQAGAMVQNVRKFIGSADPATLGQSPEFKSKRDELQKKLAAMVKASKTSFDKPWGMVALFWAAGSPHTAYAVVRALKLTIERGSEVKPLITVVAAR